MHPHSHEHRPDQQHGTPQKQQPSPRQLGIAIEEEGVNASNIDSSDGRQAIALDLHAKSVQMANDIPVDRVPPNVARLQLHQMGNDILYLTGQLKTRGRIQAGIAAAAQTMNMIVPGVGLAGSVGSHFLGWNEVSVKKQLNKSIEAFCRMASASGLDTRSLNDVMQNTHEPLSKRRGWALTLRPRSLFVTIFFPIARTVHRLINEGKWNDVEHEIRKILLLPEMPIEQKNAA